MSVPNCVRLKIGVTGIVLQLIENDLLEFDLSLSEPVQAIKDISGDTSLRLKLRLINFINSFIPPRGYPAGVFFCPVLIVLSMKKLDIT